MTYSVLIEKTLTRKRKKHDDLPIQDEEDCSRQLQIWKNTSPGDHAVVCHDLNMQLEELIPTFKVTDQGPSGWASYHGLCTSLRRPSGKG